jgi:acetolactate synthase-1/2/3 large subunit
MRVADYIARTLADRGVRHVFLVSGGGAMFLNNALGSELRLRYVCNHHEQASAMAAEGYARVSGQVGVVNVTTGPGSINALNGVFGAWTDSIPMLVLSGQVKRATCLASYNLPGLRQLGDQEVDIVRMMQGITKYAVLVTDPRTIRYHLERALYLATAGRPGPCWLDIPVDVQSSQIDPDELPAYDPAEDALYWDEAALRRRCREILVRLRYAERPVILAGTGVRLARALETFHAVAGRLGIPVTTAWTHDLIASDDPLFCGRQGTIGDRAGNLVVQNADVLLVLGSRLCLRQVSYNWEAFARHAYKIQVDVDAAELRKPTVKPDLGVHCDLGVFLAEMHRQLVEMGQEPGRHAGWLRWCKERLQRYPPVLPRHRTWRGALNPYHFIDTLFARLADDDVVVCGNATACIVTFQVARLKGRQRLFSSSGSASMGYDLPAALGAAVARGGKRVICLAGEGSLQMNVQELQTLAHHRWPVKLFVLNNGGYLSIRNTQQNFFGQQVGAGPDSGVSFPDAIKLAGAYGIPACKIAAPAFVPLVDDALAGDGPFLAEVLLDPEQTFEPRLSSRQLPDGRIVSAPLEDMYPFLDRDELRSNLFIPCPDAEPAATAPCLSGPTPTLTPVHGS